jgi:CRP-like cAMP-binding protein
VTPARSFLDSLTAAEQQALHAAGHGHSWQREERLVRMGDVADSAILLLSGQVKVHRRAADGAEVVLGLSGPGDLLGEIVAVRDARRSADVTALAPIEGVVIGVTALRALLAEHPAIALALLDLALARLGVGDTRRLEFATAESLPRVTSRLVELAERFGEPGENGVIDVSMPINQDELAAWSATSRESTARALRTLRELRLIETQRRRLRVLDLERLRAHAARL